MPARLPPPGPSFLREQEIRLGERVVRAGMARPSATDDGWWLGVLWVADDDGVVSWRDLGPSAGPPPEPPAARVGSAMANGLSGLILERDGRLGIRVGPVAPPDDPDRPWIGPAAVRVAILLEPARAATMRPTEIAQAVLGAFRRGVLALGRP